jgi:hypothetical protein
MSLPSFTQSRGRSPSSVKYIPRALESIPPLSVPNKADGAKMFQLQA